MAKSKKPVDQSRGLLVVKLGACLSCPTKRAVADLWAVAEMCRQAKNAMVRAWLRWCEDHPGWKGKPLLKDGQPVLDKRGNAVVCKQPLPDKMGDETSLFGKCGDEIRSSGTAHDDGDDGIGWSTWLYRVGADKVPNLYRSLTSSLAKEVSERLSSKVPWRAKKESRSARVYHWQQVLAFECQADSYQIGPVAVPNNSCNIGYRGILLNDIGKDEVGSISQSQAVIRLPLFSRAAGRAKSHAMFRLEIRQMSRGQRAVLDRIVRGEWKMADSELVPKETNRGVQWFLHLCYAQPRRDLGLDAANVADLTPLGKGASHPFSIAAARCKTWMLGEVGTLMRAVENSDIRKRQIEFCRSGAGKGRARFYDPIRRTNRVQRNFEVNFLRLLVREVIKYCVRNNCGKVVYREPGVGSRAFSWFAGHGLNFNWTRFLADLKAKCHLYGIELEKTGHRFANDKVTNGENAGKSDDSSAPK